MLEYCMKFNENGEKMAISMTDKLFGKLKF